MDKKVATLGLAYLFLGLAVLIGFGSSNFDQDKADCADKLVGLATCVPFVEGNAKSPTPDCCTGFKQVVDKSSKCLCVLIKDRNDPSLGFKINATLALQLPSDCHTPFNVTSCIGKYARIFLHTTLYIYIYKRKMLGLYIYIYIYLAK